jgi:hypothetical protein
VKKNEESKVVEDLLLQHVHNLAQRWLVQPVTLSLARLPVAATLEVLRCQAAIRRQAGKLSLLR